MIELNITVEEALARMTDADRAHYAENGLRRTLAVGEVPAIYLNLPRGLTDDMLLTPRSTVLP